jgi:hypothetical protein
MRWKVIGIFCKGLKQNGRSSFQDRVITVQVHRLFGRTNRLHCQGRRVTKQNTSTKHAESRYRLFIAGFLLVLFLLDPELEAVYCSEPSVDFNRTAHRYKLKIVTAIRTSNPICLRYSTGICLVMLTETARNVSEYSRNSKRILNHYKPGPNLLEEDHSERKFEVWIY